MKDDDRNPIGKSNNNPLFDTCMYIVENHNSTLQELQANIICESMISDIDGEGNHCLLLEEIELHRKDESAESKDNMYIASQNGNQIKKKTTQGWYLLAKWKDGSSK